MPTEDNGEDSLQEALKQLLSTSAKSPEAPIGEKDEDAMPSAPAGTTQEDTQAQEAPNAPPGPAEPVYEVEIVPPAASPEVKSVETAPRGTEESADNRQPKTSQLPSTLLDGAIEIMVRPTVSLARVAEFEQALRQRPEVRWLGTFGKAKLGTTIKIQLSNPVSADRLFAGDASVEKADVAKAGGIWRANVTVSAVAPQPNKEEEPPSRDALPQFVPAPVFEHPPEPVTPANQPASPAVTQAVPSTSPREIDIEASPVSSLDELNRLEKVLTSLAPGCRVVNVLSLDGVSTVLITLEGIERSVLKARLPEKMSGVDLDTTHNRVVAKLPERW